MLPGSSLFGHLLFINVYLLTGRSAETGVSGLRLISLSMAAKWAGHADYRFVFKQICTIF